MKQALQVTDTTNVQVVGSDDRVTVRLSDRAEIELEGRVADVLHMIIEVDRQLSRMTSQHG